MMMMDAKKVTFGKTNGDRDITLSFQREATEGTGAGYHWRLLGIPGRMIKYEAVYAVHNDKSICMGIVFNSVSFETGMKHYECKKKKGGECRHVSRLKQAL